MANISPSQNTPVLPNMRRTVTRPSGANCSRRNSAKLSLATMLRSWSRPGGRADGSPTGLCNARPDARNPPSYSERRITHSLQSAREFCLFPAPSSQNRALEEDTDLHRSLLSLATPTLLLDALISVDVLGIELLFSRTQRVGMASALRKRNLAQVKVQFCKPRITKRLLLRTEMKRVGAPIFRRSGGRPAACFPKLISAVEFRKIQSRYVHPILLLPRGDKDASFIWNLTNLQTHVSIAKFLKGRRIIRRVRQFV